MPIHYPQAYAHPESLNFDWHSGKWEYVEAFARIGDMWHWRALWLQPWTVS